MLLFYCANGYLITHCLLNLCCLSLEGLRKGEWKPHGQHYDFLTLIEHERQMKNTDEEEMINPGKKSIGTCH